MTEPVEYLDLDDVLGLAVSLLGEPVPIRDVGLLGSAVARPKTTTGGHGSRDLNALVREDLIRQSGRKYRPRTELVEAFLPITLPLE